MRYFFAPETYYTDHYDKVRFKLTWNLSFVISTLLIVLTLINLSNKQYSSITNILGAIVGITGLFILYKTRKYKIISIIISIAGYILVCASFFLIRNTVHYTTPMWGILIVLFTYVTLGKTWGTSILFAHFLTLILYYFFRAEGNLSNLPPFNQELILNFTLETVIVGAATAYVLIENTRANEEAEKAVVENNVELREQNDVIFKQKTEIEVMLKEIHHRVKNNLQIITSLLRLQSMDIKDESLNLEFQEAINRVKSMALIHEKIYQTDLLSQFDIEQYLESLTREITITYNIKKNIDLSVDSGLNNVSSKCIVPLALIFNELISNSIKHGLQNVTDASINVSMTNIDDTTFEMDYSDNGTWVEKKSDSTFGMELIESMTQQLEGEFELIKEPERTLYHFKLRKQFDD